MKIDSTKIGIATASAFAIIWVICSLLVATLPGAMMGMSGHMVHADLDMMQWSMGLGGLVTGLVAWSLVSGATAWLIATIYNLMS